MQTFATPTAERLREQAETLFTAAAELRLRDAEMKGRDSDAHYGMCHALACVGLIDPMRANLLDTAVAMTLTTKIIPAVIATAITLAALFALASWKDRNDRERQQRQIEADERAADALIAAYGLECRNAKHHPEQHLEMVGNNPKTVLTDEDLDALQHVPSRQLPAAIRARIAQRGGIPSPLRRDPMKQHTTGACLIPPASMADTEARTARHLAGDKGA